VINFLQAESTFSNVLHFTKNSYTTSDMVALANAVDQAVETYHLPNITTNILYVNTTVYDIRTADGPLVVNSDGSGAGAATGGNAPLNCAVVMTLRTNTRGRTGRGRVFITGFSDNELTGFTWSAAAGNAATNYITYIREAASALGWTHVIRSTQVDHVPQNPALTREVVAFDIRSLVIGTQRRRIDRI